MRIVVDSRFLQSNLKPGLSDFIKEVFNLLALMHPEEEFIFLVDRDLTTPTGLPENMATVKIAPKPGNFLLYKWWYDVKLPLVLEKYKADVFIAAAGICSLTAKVPQVLIVGDLCFLKKTSSPTCPASAFYNLYTRKFTRKAKRIVTFSDYVRVQLAAAYKVEMQAIQTVGFGAAPFFCPLDWQEREAIKEKISDGCEYFIFTGSGCSVASFIQVLKAFSIFKKWQKTNMKLVITGQFEALGEKELEKLKSYKYRQDVYIKQDLSETALSEVAGAAYALIFPGDSDGFAVPVLQALKSDVPVITSAESSMSEIAEDAALYADPAIAEDMAAQMKKVFKDEQLRSKLIELGRVRSQLFNWDKTAGLLWQAIEQAVSQ